MDLYSLPHRLDSEASTCQVVIESVKGRRNKFVYDIKSKSFELAGLLPEGMSFPLDYGFIPSTLAADGDPVDVLVLADEPAFAGAVLKVRLIGVVEAEQRKRKKPAVRNDRIIAVSVLSRLYESITSIDDLGDAFLTNLQQFWVNYNELKGRNFEITAVKGAKRACRLIEKQSVPSR
jgi:inorganic pyrophosphatase